MLLAIIGLVCLEVRFKSKTIDFRTKADFACCGISQIKKLSIRTIPRMSAPKMADVLCAQNLLGRNGMKLIV